MCFCLFSRYWKGYVKICSITAGIGRYKSIIKKKGKKLDKIVLLVKTKLNTIDFLISRALIHLYICDDQYVLVRNVSKEMMI